VTFGSAKAKAGSAKTLTVAYSLPVVQSDPVEGTES